MGVVCGGGACTALAFVECLAIGDVAPDALSDPAEQCCPN